MKSLITVKLKSYNEVNVIASFGKNLHDAYKLLRLLELEQLFAYGELPKNYTYFIEYKEKGEIKTLKSDLRECKEYALEFMSKLNANKDFIFNNFSYSTPA